MPGALNLILMSSSPGPLGALLFEECNVNATQLDSKDQSPDEFIFNPFQNPEPVNSHLTKCQGFIL